MGKPRMTALAIAIKAAEPLSDEEKQTLRDILRPAPKPRSKSKPERKPSQKRKAGKGAATEGVTDFNNGCQRCGFPVDANVHQLASTKDYHEFVEPASETKGASG